jgi:hypothetical protein
MPDFTRQPALPGFIHRKIAAINWTFDPAGMPREGSRRWDVAAAHAELDWALADWRRCNPHWNGWDHEAHSLAAVNRLPHEHKAAMVVNVWMKAHVWSAEIAKNLAFKEPDRAYIAGLRGELRKLMALLWRYRCEWKAARAEIDMPAGPAAVLRRAA